MIDSWAKAVIAVVLVVAFVAMTGGLFVVELPPGNREGVTILFGSLSSLAGLIVGYYFGSSKGAHEKDATIKAALEKR